MNAIRYVIGSAAVTMSPPLSPLAPGHTGLGAAWSTARDTRRTLLQDPRIRVAPVPTGPDPVVAGALTAYRVERHR